MGRSAHASPGRNPTLPLLQEGRSAHVTPDSPPFFSPRLAGHQKHTVETPGRRPVCRPAALSPAGHSLLNTAPHLSFCDIASRPLEPLRPASGPRAAMVPRARAPLGQAPLRLPVQGAGGQGGQLSWQAMWPWLVPSPFPSLGHGPKGSTVLPLRVQKSHRRR